MKEVNRSSDSLQDATASTDSPLCIVSDNEKIYNMYLPPQRLLEVGKKLVDNNDLVNAVSWFKRAESILFITKGEAARKHLIMVRIQLIQVLEKLKRFNEALGFCHDVLHNNPEEEFELEVLQLGGRIHFRLWNFSEAKKYVGDAYEMVCRGRGYDGIVKHKLWTILCTINVYEQQIRCRYDFYEILQVDRQDPEEKIEQAFKELEYSQGSGNYSNAEIHQAAWVLLNEDKRADYDNGNGISVDFTEYFQHPEFYHTRPF